MRVRYYGGRSDGVAEEVIRRIMSSQSRR
jgi:hypothetical protein